MLRFIDTLFAEIAAIGATVEGGSSRIAFSPEDQQVREIFAKRMVESGLTVRTDTFGNLFGRLEGTKPDEPAVATGSHLDTVPQGGRFDGVLGCVTSLAVLRDIALQQSRGLMQKLTHPLECIAFQSEESSRFAVSTLGSKILCGKGKAAIWAQLTDAEGNTFEDVLRTANLDIACIEEATLPPNYYKAFIELHIDQGPTLEDAQVALGIITDIVGVRRAKVSFKGSASHAGGTPMKLRHDALVAASEAVLAMHRIASSYEGKHSMVGTVGQLLVSPGVINIIPGNTALLCELRATDVLILDAAWKKFCSELEAIALKHKAPLTLTITETNPPVPMAGCIQDLLSHTCTSLELPAMSMASGAGHDCMNMASITDAGMIFVRSRGGLSHHSDEFVRAEDMAAGCHVLRAALSALAQ